jgi:hypothetical protein
MFMELQFLNDHQVVKAVRLFYDVAPRELWEGGEKPSAERLKLIGDALIKEAPAEAQSVITALAKEGEPDNIAARAGICRLILTRLQQSAKFKPYVDQAIDAAAPTMAMDPVTGAFIIVFLLCTTVVEPTPHGRHYRLAGGAVDFIKALRLPELLHELPAVLKALPDSIWNALARLGG